MTAFNVHGPYLAEEVKAGDPLALYIYEPEEAREIVTVQSVSAGGGLVFERVIRVKGKGWRDVWQFDYRGRGKGKAAGHKLRLLREGESEEDATRAHRQRQAELDEKHAASLKVREEEKAARMAAIRRYLMKPRCYLVRPIETVIGKLTLIEMTVGVEKIALILHYAPPRMETSYADLSESKVYDVMVTAYRMRNLPGAEGIVSEGSSRMTVKSADHLEVMTAYLYSWFSRQDLSALLGIKEEEGAAV